MHSRRLEQGSDTELVEADVVVLDGLDRAMVGVTFGGLTDQPRAVYDFDVAVACIAEQHELEMDEAAALIEADVMQMSYVEGGPIFIYPCGRMASDLDNLPSLPENLGYTH